jgi:hypothetical protein
MTLLFLAVFYGLFSSIAPREHYAFAKIAQYFPVLSVVGRIDLLFVYIVCIVLFFFVATPLHYATHFLSSIFDSKGKTLFSTIVCLALFVFTLFFNRRYDSVYKLFCTVLFPIFYLFDFGVLLLLLLPNNRMKKHKENSYASNPPKKHRSILPSYPYFSLIFIRFGGFWTCRRAKNRHRYGGGY